MLFHSCHETPPCICVFFLIRVNLYKTGKPFSPQIDDIVHNIFQYWNIKLPDIHGVKQMITPIKMLNTLFFEQHATSSHTLMAV